MGGLAIFMLAHALAGYTYCLSCDESMIKAVYWAAFAVCIGLAWLPWVVGEK